MPEITYVQTLIYRFQESRRRHGMRTRERDIRGKDARTHPKTLAVGGVAHTVAWHNSTNQPCQVLGMIGVSEKTH
jgi:hypothetical protein